MWIPFVCLVCTIKLLYCLYNLFVFLHLEHFLFFILFMVTFVFLNTSIIQLYEIIMVFFLQISEENQFIMKTFIIKKLYCLLYFFYYLLLIKAKLTEKSKPNRNKCVCEYLLNSQEEIATIDNENNCPRQLYSLAALGYLIISNHTI